MNTLGSTKITSYERTFTVYYPCAVKYVKFNFNVEKEAWGMKCLIFNCGPITKDTGNIED